MLSSKSQDVIPSQDVDYCTPVFLRQKSMLPASYIALSTVYCIIEYNVLGDFSLELRLPRHVHVVLTVRCRCGTGEVKYRRRAEATQYHEAVAMQHCEPCPTSVEGLRLKRTPRGLRFAIICSIPLQVQRCRCGSKTSFTVSRIVH